MRRSWIVMKKIINYLTAAILDFIGGICYFLAFILYEEAALPRYMFLVSSICLILSGVGFLLVHLKNKKEK